MCIFYNLTSASSEPQRDSESGTSGAVLVSFTTNSGLVSASCFCGRRFGLFPLHSRKHARTFLSENLCTWPRRGQRVGSGGELAQFQKTLPDGFPSGCASAPTAGHARVVSVLRILTDRRLCHSALWWLRGHATLPFNPHSLWPLASLFPRGCVFPVPVPPSYAFSSLVCRACALWTRTPHRCLYYQYLPSVSHSHSLNSAFW